MTIQSLIRNLEAQKTDACLMAAKTRGVNPDMTREAWDGFFDTMLAGARYMEDRFPVLVSDVPVTAGAHEAQIRNLAMRINVDSIGETLLLQLYIQSSYINDYDKNRKTRHPIVPGVAMRVTNNEFGSGFMLPDELITLMTIHELHHAHVISTVCDKSFEDFCKIMDDYNTAVAALNKSISQDDWRWLYHYRNIPLEKRAADEAVIPAMRELFGIEGYSMADCINHPYFQLGARTR